MTPMWRGALNICNSRTATRSGARRAWPSGYWGGNGQSTCSTELLAVAADVRLGDRLGGGRVAHWQLIPHDAVVFIERTRDARRRRHEPDFADASGAVRAFRIALFD